MFRLRMVGKIIRQAGLGHITVVFFAIFLACAAVLAFGDPNIPSFGDALWLCFQSITTIGFGDVYTGTMLCRVTIVVLSVVSIFYLAVITGAVVSYCTQLVESQSRYTVTQMADQLENLDKLTPEELRALSEEARKIKM